MTGESFVIDTILGARPADAVLPVVPGTRRPGVHAPGDDAALLRDGSVVTVDAMVEGVHWDHRLSAADVGWKLVAVNASDINAMGCRPTWAVLALALPNPLDRQWVQDFAAGLGEALQTWKIALIGGDTTASPGPRVATLTLSGEGARAIGRSGAQVGDDVWVTGFLGNAAAGYLHEGEDLRQLQRPSPPIGFGASLAEAGVVNAMMDLSDGLARDLSRLCKASGVSAEVSPDRLPATPSVARMDDRVALQVAFGEDYELLFTASPEHGSNVLAIGEQAGIQLSQIGRCTEAGPSPSARLLGAPWPASHFSHFGAGS